jgi:hypothetical protein
VVHRIALAVLGTVALIVAACSSPTDVSRAASAEQANAHANGAAGSSNGSHHDSTTSPTPPASATVSGRVLGVTRVAAAPGVTDTLRYTPIAGASITVYHNVLENGAGKQVFVAQLTSGADGSYSLGTIPGGYYTLWVSGPNGSGYGAGWQYLAALQPAMTFDMYLWHS